MNYKQAQQALLENQPVIAMIQFYKTIAPIKLLAIRKSKGGLSITYFSKTLKVNVNKRVNIKQEFILDNGQMRFNFDSVEEIN